MPIIINSLLYTDKELKAAPFYYWPLRWRDFLDYPYIENWLKEYRKEAVKDQEQYMTWQKEYKDKFFKEEAKYHLRLQRACTLMLGYYGVGEWRCSTNWPLELASELDEITNRIELREIDEEKSTSS